MQNAENLGTAWDKNDPVLLENINHNNQAAYK